MSEQQLHDRIRFLEAEVERLKERRAAARWVPDNSLGDHWPLPHWRCTGCGEIIGCHGKPERTCENCRGER